MKICVTTGSRAEFGLLYWLMKDIEADPDLELQVVVTGMHLSTEFGLTHREIEKNFPIRKKIEMLLSSSTPVGISKSMALAQISFAETFDELQPDRLVILGDRYEIFAAAAAAMIAGVPIAHIHGGESTEGSFDEAIRHSISKMSFWHFTAAETYMNRVIQLGETPNRVFNVGSLGLENISRLKLLQKKELEARIGYEFAKRNILVAFHPETLGSFKTEDQFKAILEVLETFEDTNLIFTKSNSDPGGQILNRMIDEFVSKREHRAVAFTSLGQLNFLSTLKYVDAIVGNSSSGIIEAPYFRKPTINVGDRQKGRLKASSVIDCSFESDDIHRAFLTAFSREFQDKLLETTNPYEARNTSNKILSILRREISQKDLKKQFYDLPQGMIQ